MLVTNNAVQDYWFGPLHLAGGVGQTLTVDDTSATSLYLLDDSVADAINNLSNSGKIGCTSTAAPFPRPTGVPQLLHGDGSPEGLVYAPQGSMYMRRDGAGSNSLYTKTSGVTINTGWEPFSVGSLGTTYRLTTAKAATNTIAETDLLNVLPAISANALATNGVARLTAWGDWVQNSGGATDVPIFTAKLNGTTLLKTALTGAAVVTNSASRFGWRIAVEIMNLGGPAVQWATLEGKIAYTSANANSQAPFTTGEGAVIPIGTNSGSKPGTTVFEGAAGGTVDTSVACPVALTVINPTLTTCETKLYGALLEII